MTGSFNNGADNSAEARESQSTVPKHRSAGAER